MSALPPIKWAQRADSLYVTIDVADIKDQNINLDGTHLTFSGKSGSRTYECKLELFAEVDPNDAKTVFSVRPRDVHFHIMKKDKDADFWPRLLKDKTLEKTNVKLDWDRYVDEDEGNSAFDMGAMGPGAMNFGDYGDFGGGGFPGGFGGGDFGGAGDDGGEDSDDDMPDLEADDSDAKKPGEV